jgi:hypothetical protein
MCSTPQKQPAATVALAADGGIGRPVPVAWRPRAVDWLKGRRRRETKDGIMALVLVEVKVVRSMAGRRARRARAWMMCVVALGLG